MKHNARLCAMYVISYLKMLRTTTLLMFILLISMQCASSASSAVSKDCTYKCQPGFFESAPCSQAPNWSICSPCPSGRYTKYENQLHQCYKCDRRCHQDEVILYPCMPTSNLVCRCKDGMERKYVDDVKYFCQACKPGQKSELVSEDGKTVCRSSTSFDGDNTTSNTLVRDNTTSKPGSSAHKVHGFQMLLVIAVLLCLLIS